MIGLKEGIIGKKLVDRFFPRVNKGLDCWTWKGAVNDYGYGIVYHEKKQYRAHRISWLIHHGEDPGKSFVCHKCDNPICVNPDHLFLGFAKDNIQDMISKGRYVGNCNTLSEEEIIDVIDLYEKGNSIREVSRLVGRGRNYIGRIISSRCSLRPYVGKEHRSTKLSECQVLEIRKRYSLKKEQIKTLAIEFCVDPSTINSIVKGITWKHI